MSISAVQSRIAQLESRIAQVSGGLEAPLAADSATTAATPAAADQNFSAVLATAMTSGTGAAAALGASAGVGSVDAAALAGVLGAGATGTGTGEAQPGTGAALVQAATKYLGVPYVWGGEDASGMDCSGLVQRSFADLGVDVPRVARDQMKIGTEVPSLAQAQPGDLVVTRGGAHIGIYVGDGSWIQAPYPGQNVKISEITSPVTTIRRVLPAGGAA